MLSDGEFSMDNCRICPRHCHVDRSVQSGFCGASVLPRLGRAALHFYEEPCISGKTGSGAVFFSGCNLKCIFCQNHVLQDGTRGKEFTVQELAGVFLDLQDQGANNINLVTPTPHLDAIIPALEEAKTHGLHIPIVYNTNSYMETESVHRLKGLVDIWLADLKYKDARLAGKLSSASDYYTVAVPAIEEMYAQSGALCIDPETSLAVSGVLIRHLVLPGCLFDTRDILNVIKEKFGADAYLSLMSQYTPTPDLPKPFDRRLTAREYDSAVEHAVGLGLEHVFIQDMSSATFAYTPEFNL